MDNSSYLEIKRIMNKFVKKNCWESFTSADIFYFHDSLSKHEALLTFMDQFYGDAFGVQLFFNKDGFNYVHDLFTTAAPDLMSVADCDSICAVFKSKSDLNEEEKDYIRLRGCRLKDENNLVIYRFKRGYRQMLSALKDENIIFKYVELLDSVIRNDKKLILEGFKLEYCAFIDVNFKELEYNLIPRPLPYLEKAPKKYAVNKSLVEELNPLPFLNDDAYLFTGYLPFTIDKSNLRPLIVYMIYPSSMKHYLGYIVDEPKGYSEKLWTIIYDAFNEVGKPSSITVYDRTIYGILARTLNSLKIENKLDKNSSLDYDGINNVLAKFYSEELIEKTLPLEPALELLEAFKITINSLNYLDEEEESYDEGETDNSNDTLVS